MISQLEHRYRSLLRVLPRWYRTEREEEMVGTFMADRDDDLDLEYGWPGWAEARAVLLLAVRTRLAGGRGGPARVVAVGDMVRLVALLGMLVQCALGVGSAVRLIAPIGWAQMMLPPRVGFFVEIGAALAAVAAFGLLLTRHRTPAKLFAVISLVPGVMALGFALWPPRGEPGVVWTAIGFGLPAWFAVACLIVGFHREAPVPAARTWLRAGVAAVGIAVVWIGFISVVPWAAFEAGFGGAESLPSWAIIIGGVVCLTMRRTVLDPSWPLALAVTAAVYLSQRVVQVDAIVYAHEEGVIGSASVVLVMAQAVALGVVGLSLAVLGIRHFWRLQPQF